MRLPRIRPRPMQPEAYMTSSWEPDLATRAGLPRRQAGAQLLPEVPPPTPAPPGPALLDPEVVRTRLSALTEGVSAALRRSPHQNPTGSNQ